MPKSEIYNTIFIHIPKTGGTSIEAALGMHGDKEFIGIKPYINQEQDRGHFFGEGLQHYSAARLAREVSNFNDCFKFSFVRNPFDRLVSAVSFLGGLRNSHKPLTKDRFEKTLKEGIPRSGHFVPQYDFLYKEDGTLMVDFVGKYENLKNDFNFVCSKLGINKTLDHRMRSTHSPYQEYYNRETREIVAEKYAKDIEYFGYEFGE